VSLFDEPSQKPPDPLRWICWLPLLSLFVIEVYVRNFDGWGAWTAAPILILPGLISLTILIPALIACVAEVRAGTMKPMTFLYTLAAGLPIFWLGVRRFFT
jgi:hypothetical protein